MSAPPAVTELLSAAGAGDEAAIRQLYTLTYEELRRLAHRIRAGHAAQTLNTTALVHEAYLKLVPGRGLQIRDRVHFFRIAARAMRQVLIDAARRRATRERGLVALGVTGGDVSGTDRLAADAVALGTALEQLERLNPRQAEVIECRFFAGLSVEDTAAALGISTPTVKRDWRVARAWLAHALDAADPPPVAS
jgi:RNA polymerase sigma factor (TIGR02999 family)